MLRKLEDFIGCRVVASDGDVGSVKDVLFDTEKWAVRHLVVDTGDWLRGNQVLVSPIAVRSFDPSSRRLEVSQTRQAIENAPSITEDEPVSRQYESSYYEYYGWPPYWYGPMLWGYWPAPGLMTGERPRSAIEQELDARAEAQRDENLHSFKEVNGYGVEASDGRMGDIEDIVIDDATWKLRYVVVDTSKLLPSKDVLVPPEDVRAIVYNQSRVQLDMTKDELRQQPEFTSLEALQEGQTEGPVTVSRSR